MLTIFKREDGKSPYYYIRGTVRFGRKRKTVKESTGCLKKADAERVCAARTREIILGLEHENHMTFSECLEKMYNNSKHCPQSKRMSLFKRVNKILGHHHLSELNNDLIAQYAFKMFPVLEKYKGVKLRDLAYDERQEASRKFNTANNNYIAVVSKVLHYGARQDWCKDPTIEHFEVLGNRSVEKRHFTVEEVNRCVENTEDAQIKMLLIFLIYTGCRISEALNMNWKEKNPENNHPMIDMENDMLNIWQFKTQEWRTIPMHERVREFLDRINDREGFLFEWKHQHQDQNNRKGIPQRWDVMLQLAKVPFKTRHDCRHTHATWLLDNGASKQEIMKVVGWKSDKVALGYIDTTDSKVKHLINGLPK